MALSLLTENKTGGGEGSPSVTLADPALGPRPTGAEPESFGAAPVEGRPPWPVVFGALILCVVSVMLGAQGAVIAEMMKETEWMAISEVEFRDPLLLPETVAVTLQSPSIWHPVAEREGFTDEEFQKNYETGVAGGTQIIQVSFVDTDTDRARRVVNGVVAAYLERFSAPDIENQSTTIRDYIIELQELEASILAGLEDREQLSQARQIDLQDQLVRTRAQISSVTLQLADREAAQRERTSTDPRLVSSGFILEEPVTPAPLNAAVFGAGAGGVIGTLLIYLTFHRASQPVEDGESDPPDVASPNAMMAAETGETGESAAADRLQSPTLGHAVPLAMKRGIDLVLGTLLLVLCLPVLLLSAAAIKATSPGPALFRQERIGKDGRTFSLIKLRTLVVDNDDSQHRAHVEDLLTSRSTAEQLDPELDPDPNPVEAGVEAVPDGYKLRDPRVTGVGRVLRRFSIDELPQLWNVVRGEMSIVGPRPALPWENELFDPRYRSRQRALPGCSGLWQVSGRSLMTTWEMLELDLAYVQDWTLRRDLWILLRTPLVVLRGDGAR